MFNLSPMQMMPNLSHQVITLEMIRQLLLSMTFHHSPFLLWNSLTFLWTIVQLLKRITSNHLTFLFLTQEFLEGVDEFANHEINDSLQSF